MRLALTGGGTGGHVYPALEVGRLALQAGDDVRYFGSLRGLEGSASQSIGIEFLGVEASPIPKLFSLAGLRSVLTLFKSTNKVKTKFTEWRPDVLLATGGYSSGPALRAAQAMDIPIVVHEQNSIPGRAIKMAGAKAKKVCTVFKETCNYFDKAKVIETGMPIRRSLIEASTNAAPVDFTTLASGGSQGARAINQAIRNLAADVGEDHWIHIAGTKLIGELNDDMLMPGGYKVVPFLQSDEMADALGKASLAIVRSGCGTVAELALFGVPAIFIPLPTSFANHQLYNAKEIEALGGGSVLEQSNLTLESLKAEWLNWRGDKDRRSLASQKLKAWSKPDAGEKVLQVVKEAAQ